MREDKARLERAAMLMFVRALRLAHRRELQIVEQRERPDFVGRDRAHLLVGVEITHLYHSEEEARFLNGRSDLAIHPLTTAAELLDALNRTLDKKATLSHQYERFGALWLLIRVSSPEVPKRRVAELLHRVRVPPSAFDEIWMLFYDFDHLDWADLLQLR